MTRSFQSTLAMAALAIAGIATPLAAQPLLINATPTLFNVDMRSVLPGPPYHTVGNIFKFSSVNPLQSWESLTVSYYSELNAVDHLATVEYSGSWFTYYEGREVGVWTANEVWAPLNDGVFSLKISVNYDGALLESLQTCGGFRGVYETTCLESFPGSSEPEPDPDPETPIRDVPEPTSFALLAAGLAGMAAVRRRKQ